MIKVIGLVVIVIGLVFIVQLIAREVLFPKGEGHWSSIKTCNEFVKQELIHPSGADFKGPFGMGGDSHEMWMPGGEWWVSSHVDTRNSIGVTQRIGFRCKMEWSVEGGVWKLIDLEWGGQVGVK